VAGDYASSEHGYIGVHLGREPRLSSSIYDRETLGTSYELRATETPEKNTNKLMEIFKIVRESGKDIPGPSQTLQPEEEAINASGVSGSGHRSTRCRLRK